MLILFILFGVGLSVFLRYNMGLARNSRGQQQRRYLLAALQAVIPMEAAVLAGHSDNLLREALLMPCSTAIAASLLTALLWMTVYNVTYDLTHRASSPDYDNHMDIAFGIYLFGWLTALQNIIAWFSPIAAAIVVGIAESVLIIIPLAQAVYYAVYRTCVDEAGMQPLVNTYWSEAREFVKSFPIWKTALSFVSIGAVIALCIAANASAPAFPLNEAAMSTGTATAAFFIIAIFIYFTAYIWKPSHGLFVRTGIMTLYIDVRTYNRSTMGYRTGMKQRLETLEVEKLNDSQRRGKTIIMVIGESACRDYMSAFCPSQPWETTPWETQMRNQKDSGFVFFPNAYSCAMQTVPSLERVLTERNQYNDKPFADSCSIIDIARRAGYVTKWYSNQSYIGINDTSVTLVAQTSDTAKWVKKEGGIQQFDESLLSFLDEINPEDDNFVVLHLKGSHFNYENRYPESFAKEHGLRTDGGDVECYRNSIRYTDHVLERIYSYAKQKLNLQSMIYFSDHGGIPDMRRSPRFLGFKMVRIPLWTYLSDEYRKQHADIAEALTANSDRYFTNDLVYELVCGILDVRSNRYDRAQSIASTSYKYKRNELLTYDGRIRIEDDDLDTNPKTMQ